MQLSYYFHPLFAKLAGRGIHPTAAQSKSVHNFIARAEQAGLHNVPQNRTVRFVYGDLVNSHAASFQLAFYASAGLALIGAVACLVLVRLEPRTLDRPVFGPPLALGHGQRRRQPRTDAACGPEGVEH